MKGAPYTRVLGSGTWLGSVVLVGAMLRLAHLWALSATPWFDHLLVDPEFYDAWAQRVAAGVWVADEPFYMDPLYPYALGLLYRAFGRDLLLARVANVVCSIGACLCVARLARRVAGPPAGGVAALGFALYKPDIFATGELDKTSLSVLLAASFLLLACGRSLPSRIGTGATLALAALTRANFLVFAPLVALAYLLDPVDRRTRVGGIPRSLWHAAAFGAAFLATLSPAAWHNHHVSGHWILTTAQAGQNFYTGNNPTNPYGAYGVVPFVRANPHFERQDFRAEAERRTGRTLDANETSRFWFGEAFAHMRAEPAFAARAFARKLALFWNDFEISDSQDQYLVARTSWVLRLPLPGFGALVPFMLLGAASGFHAHRRVRLLVGFVAAYCATLVAFFLFSRYRIQVVPAMLALAAIGLLEIPKRVHERDVRRIVAGIAMLLGGGAFAFQTIGLFSVDHPRVVEHRLRHLASLYATTGDAPRAIAVLQEAIPHCTHGCPWALKDLFDVYTHTGRAAEGVAYFRSFVARYPRQADAPGYLAELETAAR